MKLKSIFNTWAKNVKPEYSRKQWLLSKWEMFEGIEWPAEKSALMLQSILGSLKPTRNDCLIELGCGGGWILNQLKRHSRKAYGLDFSTEMLKHAGKMVPSSHLICGDISRLPFKPNQFDRVLCYYVLLNNSANRVIESSLLGIWNLLKKKGRALIGQMPDQSKSHLYDDAKKSYIRFHKKTQELGQNTAQILPTPLKLFDKTKLQKFLEKEHIGYKLVNSFNPFYYAGQPTMIDWRFDIIFEK